MNLRHSLALLLLSTLYSLTSAQSGFTTAEALSNYFQWNKNRPPEVSAHRGGPYPGYPENCIATFDNVLKHTPALIECDISLTADSMLVLMHDESVNRTSIGDGKTKNLSLKEIQSYYLVDNDGNATSFTPPSLKEVLIWSEGKAILTLDIKKGVPFEMIIKKVRETKSSGRVVIITYNVNDALKVHKLAPDLMISASIRNFKEWQAYENSGIPDSRLIAFTGVSLASKSLYKELHRHGICCMLGTLGNLDKRASVRGGHIYRDFIDYGVDILATDRPIEAAEALKLHAH